MIRVPAHLRSLACAFVLGVVAAPVARAQCLNWKSDFRQSTTNDSIQCLLAYDDGSGPALYAGGAFTIAGGIAVNGIGRWDGVGWSSLGSGVSFGYGTGAGVASVAVFDDGTGPALYVGGSFDHAGGIAAGGVARWDGHAWSALGGISLTSGLFKLVAFDDGSGPALYAGGYFIGAGLPPGTNNIVRWDGQQWSAVGTGPPFGTVVDMIVADVGSGPALYNGRWGANPSSISRWNGSSWVPIATNFVPSGAFFSLQSFDDGTGSALFLAGEFEVVEGVSTRAGVARWNGTNWTNAGNGLPTLGLGGRLSVVDDGSGLKLYIVTAENPGHPQQIMVWNGTGWSPALPGVTPLALAAFDNGSGTAIYAGGGFQPSASSTLSGLARWNGTAWSPPGDPTATHGTNNSVHSLAAFDDGSGPKLFATGEFTLAGSAYVFSRAARFDGATWSALPGYTPDGLLQVLDLGNGPVLLLAYTNIYIWQLTQWVALPGSALGGSQNALGVFDLGSGPSLYAGGNFGAAGTQQLNGIGRYTGSGWAPLGTGMTGVVNALEAFNGGGAMRLYAGGTFDTAGGVSALHLAQWDGTSWASVASGTDNHVYALHVFDDGSGPVLFVGGAFSTAGGVAAQGVARWNGSTFAPAGAGLNGLVRSFAEFDDGSGPALYACGAFTSSAGDTVPRIAKWTGSTWTSLGSGVDGSINTMAVFNDGTGPALFFGGTFGTAGAEPSVNIAAWRACTSSIEPMCFGDGSVRPCPCSNEGLAGHGCQNSASTGGARLTATGTTSPDSLVLHSLGELPSSLSIFLQGNQLISAGVRFGDGVRCAGGLLVRLFAKSASGGSVSAPQSGDPSVSARSAQLGDVIAPGSVRYYQTYYRDPNLAFCAPPQGDAWNVTQGLRIVW